MLTYIASVEHSILADLTIEATNPKAAQLATVVF